MTIPEPGRLARLAATLLLLSLLSACSSGDSNPADHGTIEAKKGLPEAVDRNTGAKPHNILLIIADDLSHDHYGFAGHPTLKTPSIDALAAQSVRFPASYGSSACRPSFATLLTGLPEHKHGVTYIGGPKLGPFSTVAHRLAEAGYNTFLAGKFWEGTPREWGFSDHVRFDARNGNVSIGRTPLDPVFEFLRDAESPWFIWFSPRMPHSPHDAPDEFLAMYEGLGLDTATVGYYAMISWFDAVVGSLLQHVPEDTVIVYLADNGFVQSAWPELQTDRSKTTSYEHGIRTQLLIRHPEHAAIVRADLSQTEDVTATILAIANAKASDLPGRNLLAPPPAESSAFGSRSSLKKGSPSVLLERWVRVEDWKLVDAENGDDRMHNLALDPGENENLVDDPDYAARQALLRDKLETLWAR